MYIGLLIPDNISLTVADFIIVMKMVDVDLGLKRPATLSLTIVHFFVFMLMVEVEIGIKIPSSITPAIFNQELMLIGYVDIGLIPATLPFIIQVSVVYC